MTSSVFTVILCFRYWYYIYFIHEKAETPKSSVSHVGPYSLPVVPLDLDLDFLLSESHRLIVEWTLEYMCNSMVVGWVVILNVKASVHTTGQHRDHWDTVSLTQISLLMFTKTSVMRLMGFYESER